MKFKTFVFASLMTNILSEVLLTCWGMEETNEEKNQNPYSFLDPNSIYRMRLDSLSRPPSRLYKYFETRYSENPNVFSSDNNPESLLENELSEESDLPFLSQEQRLEISSYLSANKPISFTTWESQSNNSISPGQRNLNPKTLLNNPGILGSCTASGYDVFKQYQLAYEKSQDYDKLLESTANPGVDQLLEAARLSRKAAEFSKAAEYYQKACLSPHANLFPQLYSEAATCFIGTKKFDEAKFYFQKSLDEDSFSPEHAYIAGDLFYQAGQYDQAAKFYEKISFPIKYRSTTHNTSWIHAAETYYNLNDIVNASKFFLLCLATETRKKMTREQCEHALNIYEQAEDLTESDDKVIHSLLRTIMYHCSDEELAMRAYDLAVTRKINLREDLCQQMSFIWVNQKQWEKASNYYKNQTSDMYRELIDQLAIQDVANIIECATPLILKLLNPEKKEFCNVFYDLVHSSGLWLDRVTGEIKSLIVQFSLYPPNERIELVSLLKSFDCKEIDNVLKIFFIVNTLLKDFVNHTMEERKEICEIVNSNLAWLLREQPVSKNVKAVLSSLCHAPRSDRQIFMDNIQDFEREFRGINMDLLNYLLFTLKQENQPHFLKTIMPLLSGMTQRTPWSSVSGSIKNGHLLYVHLEPILFMLNDLSSYEHFEKIVEKMNEIRSHGVPIDVINSILGYVRFAKYPLQDLDFLYHLIQLSVWKIGKPLDPKPIFSLLPYLPYDTIESFQKEQETILEYLRRFNNEIKFLADLLNKLPEQERWNFLHLIHRISPAVYSLQTQKLALSFMSFVPDIVRVSLLPKILDLSTILTTGQYANLDERVNSVSYLRQIIIDTISRCGQDDLAIYLANIHDIAKYYLNGENHPVSLQKEYEPRQYLGVLWCILQYLPHLPLHEQKFFAQLIHPFLIKMGNYWNSLYYDKKSLNKLCSFLRSLSPLDYEKLLPKIWELIGTRGNTFERIRILFFILDRGLSQIERLSLIENCLSLQRSTGSRYPAGFYYALSYLPKELYQKCFEMTQEHEIQPAADVSFYIATFLNHSPDIKEQIFGYWHQLLQSQDAKTAKNMADHIIRNRHHYGFFEESFLVQEALGVQILVDDPKGPYALFKELCQRSKEEIDLSTLRIPEEVLEENRVQINPLYLKTLPRRALTFKDLPAHSKSFLEEMTKVLDQKPALEIETILGESYHHLKTGALGGYVLQNLLNVNGGPDDLVPVIARKFVQCVAYIESLSADVDPGCIFSPREYAFLKMLAIIQNCQTGKEGGILVYHSSLPLSTNSFPNEGEELKQKAIFFLNTFISQEVQLFLNSNSAFLKSIIGMKPHEKIRQEVHQSIYIQNLIWPDVGLLHTPTFDMHAQSLYQKIVDSSKWEVLNHFYAHFVAHDRINSLLRVVNEDLQRKNSCTFMVLSSLMDSSQMMHAWNLDIMGTATLTERGAIHLLTQVGFLILKEA